MTQRPGSPRTVKKSPKSWTVRRRRYQSQGMGASCGTGIPARDDCYGLEITIVEAGAVADTGMMPVPRHGFHFNTAHAMTASMANAMIVRINRLIRCGRRPLL